MQQNWKYIYTVYKKRSFSKAAQELYMTQPTLSIAIQKVEKEIGMPLFDREKKPLELTDAGEIYIEKLNQMQALEDELEMRLNDLSQLKIGRIHLGGTHYLNSYILPPVLAAFQEKYPGIQLSLSEAGSFDLLTMLAENEIDLTLNCTPSPENAFNRMPGFRDIILLAVPAHFAANKSLQQCALSAADVMNNKHLSHDFPSVNLDSFSSIPFIMLTTGNNLYHRCLALFEQHNIKPQISLQVSQLVTAYHLAQSGIGATFISSRLVTQNHADMNYYKIDSPLTIRNFDLITSYGRYMSHAQKAFIELFQQYYADTFSYDL